MNRIACVRTLWKWAAIAASLSLGACASNSDAPDAGCGTAVEGPDAPDALAYDLAAERRAQCCFQPEARTTESVGASVPLDVRQAISHVVVLMMENRSYDEMLGAYPGANGSTNGSNPDPSSPTLQQPQYHESRFCVVSPDHEWGDAHLQFNRGHMDGFVAASRPGGGRAMGYYTESDLPFFYWLASHYAMSDRHFSSLLGPTWPNRFFLFAGTSCGFTEGGDSNQNIILNCGLKTKSIFNLLDEAPADHFPVSRRYQVYDESVVASVVFVSGLYLKTPKPIADFENDAANGSLPAVSIVGANTGTFGEGDDDHPPVNVQLGQQFLYRIVSALESNPREFERTVLFITYDEHGGFYDHVPPPPACDPVNPGATCGHPAPAGPPNTHDYEFDRYGVRVPLIVVSPHVRAGYVSPFTTDHTSITRFIEHWLDLGALTARDANAWPMLDVFDFDHKIDAPLPAASTVALSADGVAQCQAEPGGASGVPR